MREKAKERGFLARVQISHSKPDKNLKPDKATLDLVKITLFVYVIDMASSRTGNSEQMRRGFHMKFEIPFLDRFVEERLQYTAEYDDFLSTMDLFADYQLTVQRWTDGDSEQKGHSLQKSIKSSAFQTVRE